MPDVLQKIRGHPRPCLGVQVLIRKGHQYLTGKKPLLAAPQPASLRKGQPSIATHFSQIEEWWGTFALFPRLILISLIYHSRQENTLRSSRLRVSCFTNRFANQTIKQGDTARSCVKTITRALRCRPVSHSHRAAGRQRTGATCPSCSSGPAHHHTYKYGCDTQTVLPSCTCLHPPQLFAGSTGREQGVAQPHNMDPPSACAQGWWEIATFTDPQGTLHHIPFCSSSPACSFKCPWLQTSSPRAATPAQ